MEHRQGKNPTQESSVHHHFALPVAPPDPLRSRSVAIHRHTATSHLESAKRCGHLWTHKNNPFNINHLDFDTPGGWVHRYSTIRATTS